MNDQSCWFDDFSPFYCYFFFLFLPTFVFWMLDPSPFKSAWSTNSISWLSNWSVCAVSVSLVYAWVVPKSFFYYLFLMLSNEIATIMLQALLKVKSENMTAKNVFEIHIWSLSDQLISSGVFSSNSKGTSMLYSSV